MKTFNTEEELNNYIKENNLEVYNTLWNRICLRVKKAIPHKANKHAVILNIKDDTM